MTALVPRVLEIERIRDLLRKCRTADEAKAIRDKVVAVKVYLRQRGASVDIQNDAAREALNAERRMGELLAGSEMHPGGRPPKTGNPKVPVSKLRDLGLSKKESARAQALAAIPPEVFERRVTTAVERSGRITAAAVLRTGDGDRTLSQWDTRPETARWLVKWAGVKKRMRVLEPSAGKGNIVRELLAVGARVTAVEIDKARAAALDHEAVEHVHCGDFLAWAPQYAPGDYDMAVMNPPYEHDQDRQHILAALTLAPVVVVLARLVLLEGQERRETLWEPHSLTRMRVLSERESFEGEVDGNARSAFAAYRIERGPGRSVVEWQ